MQNIPEKTVPCTQDGEPYANTPDELKAQALWCCYKNEPKPDGGKPSKVPYNPLTGKYARINDTGSLCGFAEAVAGVKSGRYDGINVAFGYEYRIGIDLDNTLDKSTGEFICDEAREIFDKFREAGAYIETSPSGAGLRIICRGALPKFGKGRGEYAKFEVYGQGDGGLHFLSITGNALQAVDKLPVCQATLMWFYDAFIKREGSSAQERPAWNREMSPPLEDAAIIEKLRRSKRGAEFSTPRLLRNCAGLSVELSFPRYLIRAAPATIAAMT